MLIELRRSKQLLMILIMMHLFALIAISLLAAIWWFKLIMVAGCHYSFWCFAERYGWIPGQKTITKMATDGQGSWQVDYDHNTAPQTYLLTGGVVFPLGILLYLKATHRRFTLPYVVMNDAIRADTLRQLRAWVRSAETWQK